MTILIDADAFIGLRNEKDAHHQQARMLLEGLNSRQVVYMTSWDVIQETATKLSYYAGKGHCEAFLNYLDHSGIEVLYPNSQRANKAKRVMLSIPSKRVSLTDAMNMALAQEIGADYIFSFDKVYPQNGFKLLKDAI